ncbi:hypothetical protein M407DRAFT_245087 [Tulasnella calospora MUT 4182]|uniref:Mitochondrial import inner membrane translocase subunit TIM22 n=1 Tax=Tulasnella calospora MUT 4182 TaxID=1051891 RepID=A0A0C3QD60_9AGAM|nr:hypothetical protein M407DRAFT_245087 [Tulasnella calospora MUT 4182]
MSPPPGLFPPLFPEGREPLPPDWTDEERQNYATNQKVSKYFGFAMESCVTKTVMAGVVGTGVGAAFSLMGATFSYEAAYGTHTQQTTKAWFRDQGQKMWRTGRSFGKVGALYSGTECVIESYRAKNDIYNPIAAGFLSGAILARNSGPTAALGGGVAFAIFSAGIELFLHRETHED